MGSKRGRAVIASPFRPEADRLCALVGELGFEQALCAPDGLQALRLIEKLRPDALIADEVLPVMDGTALIGRLNSLPLTVVPATVLLTVPGMRLRREGITGLCAVVDKPADAQKLEAALATVAPERRPVNEEIRQKTQDILKSLGIPEHPGREYLVRAIWIARQDARFLQALTTRLYPAVAEACGVKARQVERAMAHVIDIAWRSGEIEAQYQIFGDTIDARRGNPTCGEMIAQIADILRWEGNA